MRIYRLRECRLLLHFYFIIMKARSNILILIVFILQLSINAQTPGIILKPASAQGQSVLDPNGDGYVSFTTDGFNSNDVSESEIPFSLFVNADPSGDILSGPTCGWMDIVGTDASGNYGIMIRNDGTNLIFRFRLSGFSNNSKAYSVLLDIDNKFGFTGVNADPNAITGNAGFEVEVVLRTNFSVDVYNVDGTTSPLLCASNSYETNCQKSMALTKACGNPDYFYDFYVPVTQLTAIAGLGITSNTPLRIAATTGMAPKSVIGSHSYSDINGPYTGSNIDLAFISTIAATYPLTLSTLTTTGVIQRSACPLINQISTGANVISGTTTESAGTVSVKVYQSNGTTLLGTATGSISNGTWSVPLSSFSPSVNLTVDQIVKASVIATGKGESFDDCNPKTVLNCTSITSVPTVTEIVKASAGKGYEITVNRPIGTMIYLYDQYYNLVSTSDLVGSVQNPTTTTANPQTINLKCQTGWCFPNGIYYFAFKEPGKCVSVPFYISCDYAVNGTSSVPTITTLPLTTSTTIISGTCASSATLGTRIDLYANGILLKSTTVVNSTSWTISGLDLSTYSVETIIIKETDEQKCPSMLSARLMVKPIINNSGCTTTSITSISGFSVEEVGTTITLYKINSGRTSLGTTTVQADGTWTKTGLSLVTGDIIIAVASGTYMSTSADSDPITIKTQADISNYTIGITTPSESQSSVSGTISGGTYPVTLKLYVDQEFVGNSITVSSAGIWTVNGLKNFDLAFGSTVAVTITGSGCESNFSSITATVNCVAPTDKTISVPSALICKGAQVPITVSNSEHGVIYQLFKAGSQVGSSMLGNGGDIVILSPSITSTTTLGFKAKKESSSTCVSSLSASTTVTINQIFYSDGSDMLGLTNWYSSSNHTGINACGFTISNDYFIIPTNTSTAASNDFTTGSEVTFQVDGVADFQDYIATVPILINNGKVQFSGTSNGFAISTGTVEYDGTDQFVGGGIYNNLMISGSGIKTLSGDVVVNNIFDLHTPAFVDLNGYKLTINNWADGHIPTLTADRYIILHGGTITVNGVNAGETVQFPMSLSSAVTDYCRVDLSNNDNAHTSFTITSVSNYSNDIGTSSGGTEHTSKWVKLTYNISSLSTNAVVKLYWDESKELVGFNRNKLQVNHHNGTAWEKKGIPGLANTLSGSIHYFSALATSFSPYGIGNDESNLPIELSSFNVIQTKENVFISWKTLTETNNDYFTIEKSNDGEHWKSIYTCNGAGNSTIINSYSYLDEEPYNGVNIYRIKQTDNDGNYSYSSIKSLKICNETILFNVYPIPVTAEELTVIIQGKEFETIHLSIEDVNGSILCSGDIEISKIPVIIKVSDICTLSSGIYIISIKGKNQIQSKKVVIQ